MMGEVTGARRASAIARDPSVAVSRTRLAQMRRHREASRARELPGGCSEAGATFARVLDDGRGDGRATCERNRSRSVRGSVTDETGANAAASRGQPSARARESRTAPLEGGRWRARTTPFTHAHTHPPTVKSHLIVFTPELLQSHPQPPQGWI